MKTWPGNTAISSPLLPPHLAKKKKSEETTYMVPYKISPTIEKFSIQMSEYHSTLSWNATLIISVFSMLTVTGLIPNTGTNNISIQFSITWKYHLYIPSFGLL